LPFQRFCRQLNPQYHGTIATVDPSQHYRGYRLFNAGTFCVQGRPVGYVQSMMRKCIMVKVGGKQKQQKRKKIREFIIN